MLLLFSAFDLWAQEAHDVIAMKVEIPAIAFVRGFKVDHEPIMRFKDDWRPTWLIISQFERSLARPWKPRRAIDQALDTSERVKK